MGPVHPLNFFGLFMVRVVTLLLVLFSTNLTNELMLFFNLFLMLQM